MIKVQPLDRYNEPHIFSFYGGRFYLVRVLKRYIQRFGRQTNTRFAEILWIWSNQASTPVNSVYALFDELGYVPFTGFPLEDKHKKGHKLPWVGHNYNSIEKLISFIKEEQDENSSKS